MPIPVLTCASMAATRIHRYLLKEICSPAFFSLLIFTFVLLMGRITRLTELVISKGIPATEILQLFSYLLPSFFSFTIPLSLLLGILLAFGRLSADSEYIALKASGVSLYSLVQPILALAVCCCLLTGWITISIEPKNKAAFRATLFQIATSRASVGIQSGIFNDAFDGIVLYCSELDEQRGILQGVFISDERDGETPATVLAQQGRFISDPETSSLTLRLSNGSIHRRPVKTGKTSYQTINFGTYDVHLDLEQQLSSEQERRRSTKEFSWQELNQAYHSETTQEWLRSRVATEKQKRLSLAFAPLVLALVGVPLGLQSHRSGKGSGFTLALAIAITYYLLLNATRTLASKGGLPATAVWLPNLCFLLGGCYLIRQTAREKTFRFMNYPAQLLSALKKILFRRRRKS